MNRFNPSPSLHLSLSRWSLLDKEKENGKEKDRFMTSVYVQCLEVVPSHTSRTRTPACRRPAGFMGRKQIQTMQRSLLSRSAS